MFFKKQIIRGRAYAESKHRTNGLKLAKVDIVAACKLDPKNKAFRKELQNINKKNNPGAAIKKKEEVVDKGFLKDGKSTSLYEDDEAKVCEPEDAVDQNEMRLFYWKCFSG